MGPPGTVLSVGGGGEKGSESSMQDQAFEEVLGFQDGGIFPNILKPAGN